MSPAVVTINETQLPVRHTGDNAGFWLRLVAHIIDGFIAPVFAAPVALVGLIPMFFVRLACPDAPDFVESFCTIWWVLWLVILCSTGILYFALFESSPLQATPGKLALGLIVTDLNGERISFWKALGRNLAKGLSYLSCYIGFLLAAFTEDKQALHDIVASCLVVRKSRAT
jgi:uncharacterized RDD family membrane protein YckC